MHVDVVNAPSTLTIKYVVTSWALEFAHARFAFAILYQQKE